MPTKRIPEMTPAEFDVFVATQTKKLVVVEKKAGELRRLLKQIARKAGDEKLEAHLDAQTKKLFNIEAMAGDLHRTVGTTLKWYRQVQTGTMPSSSSASAPQVPAAPPLKGIAKYNAERKAAVEARKAKAKPGNGAQAR